MEILASIVTGHGCITFADVRLLTLAYVTLRSRVDVGGVVMLFDVAVVIIAASPVSGAASLILFTRYSFSFDEFRHKILSVHFNATLQIRASFPLR